MMTQGLRWILVVVVFQFTACDCCAQPLDQYLVTKGNEKQLKGRVVLKEEQGGAGGRTVTEWTVEPNGEWVWVTYQIDSKGRDRPYSRVERGKGKLSSQHLTELARAMAEDKLKELPAKQGQESKINLHRYSILFGDEPAKTLVGTETRRSESIQSNIAKDAPPVANPADWTRFAHVADTIATKCSPRKNPP